MSLDFIAGIDEAGRGPIAGPVAVGIFVCKKNFNFLPLPGLDDSKKLSEKKRNEIFLKIKELVRHKKARFFVALVSNKVIDSKGITFAIKKGIEECIKKIKISSKNTFVYLDGSLRAPEDFKQKTVIKGDSKIKAISAASICAKVIRDEYMKKNSKIYLKYSFEKHKGYGTKEHYESIKIFGVSQLHRKTFLNGFNFPQK